MPALCQSLPSVYDGLTEYIGDVGQDQHDGGDDKHETGLLHLGFSDHGGTSFYCPNKGIPVRGATFRLFD
jgi:hypothetical protein